ncbi:hypothetical protein HaLaN_29198, partial [Haematococcus lacustris]
MVADDLVKLIVDCSLPFNIAAQPLLSRLLAAVEDEGSSATAGS